MALRTLVLFDVEGVLVKRGELRRVAGAAEGLARLRHETDAVLSVATTESRKCALRKATVVGVDRYLDLDVGAYGGESVGVPALVRLARERTLAAYGGEFDVLVVTAGIAVEVARLRPAADTLIALAPKGGPVAELRAAGADHVVANLLEVAELARGVPAN